jgi:energy-converting hydrogenase Eha subunit C
MNTVFQLAPRSRRHDIDKALAFAIAPAAPSFAAIYFFADQLPLALIVTTVCFVGTFICALTLASTPLGRIVLTPDSLLLDSGSLHARVPLASLDLAAARIGADPSPALRLDTLAAHAVTIPARSGQPLVVTPLDREAFLQTLRSLAS